MPASKVCVPLKSSSWMPLPSQWTFLMSHSALLNETLSPRMRWKPALAGGTVPPANAGFHLILGDSVSFNNAECDIKNVHWDGNGIQLDDFNGTQTFDAGIQPYPRPTLVENNLCFANGGAGIMTGGGGSSFITVRSNT